MRLIATRPQNGERMVDLTRYGYVVVAAVSARRTAL